MILTGNGDSLVSDGVCKDYTKPTHTSQFRTRDFFSLGSPWAMMDRGNLTKSKPTKSQKQIKRKPGSHANSSHEASLEPTTKRRKDLGEHNVHTHFPEDRNCEICKRTKITRAPCRRRNGEAVPRAAKFGDLITADHKVLSDNCESRNNHRYAVVVQDLATQWIQAYPCKNKTSQETQRSLQKFLEPERNSNVIYTEIPWHSAKLVKISPGIIARLHHTDRRLMVLRKEQCAE